MGPVNGVTIDTLFESVIEHLQEGVQLIGPDFRYLYLNPTAARHGQRRADELVGVAMTEAYPGIDTTEMFGHLRRIMSDGGCHHLENEFTFPDGSTGWFELRLGRVPAGVVILSVDITERKRAEANARRMQKMEAVGQLASGVAHDFNNLLTVIQANAWFLDEACDSDDPRKEDAGTILMACQQAAELTRKLLAFSKSHEQPARAVDVNEALDQLAQLLRRTLHENIRIDVSPGEGAPRVCVDPSALDQVLMNLALNARDAMPQGGSLAFVVDDVTLDEAWTLSRGEPLAPGTYVCISVSDTGEGIAPEVLDRVFEPFFTTKGDDKGTGLGLASCWGLCRQAKGSIGVYSEVGVGTTFRVYLPQSNPAELPKAPAPPPSAFEPTAITVLVVDDKPDVQRLARRILSAEGFHLLEAQSAADALRQLENANGRVDLLLTDVNMPRMSGAELVEEALTRFPGLVALLMSGFAVRGAQMRVHEQDIAVLPKPFPPGQLVSAIAGVLRSRREPEHDGASTTL